MRCSHCGHPFTPTSFPSPEPLPVFCSRRCYEQWRSLQTPGYDIERLAKDLEIEYLTNPHVYHEIKAAELAHTSERDALLEMVRVLCKVEEVRQAKARTNLFDAVQPVFDFQKLFGNPPPIPAMFMSNREAVKLSAPMRFVSETVQANLDRFIKIENDYMAARFGKPGLRPTDTPKPGEWWEFAPIFTAQDSLLWRLEQIGPECRYPKCARRRAEPPKPLQAVDYAGPTDEEFRAMNSHMFDAEGEPLHNWRPLFPGGIDAIRLPPTYTDGEGHQHQGYKERATHITLKHTPPPQHGARITGVDWGESE